MKPIDMRDAFFERVVELAKIDQRIVFLTVDHGAFALKRFEKEIPQRYINMGISEQNMIGVAAGLAASGKIVFAYGITPFVSLRILEQITLDVAAMQLPVIIVSVGAGFTYSTDGPTHHGLQDLPAILTVPQINILNSSDPLNTKAFVDLAVESGKPYYIRIEKEKLLPIERQNSLDHDLKIGFSNLRFGSDLLLITTGAITHQVLEVAGLISKNSRLETGVIDLHQLKPISEDALCLEIKKYKRVVTIEENYIAGGIGSAIATIMAESGNFRPLLRLGIGDIYCFQYSISRQEILKRNKLDKKEIMNSIIKWGKG